MVQLIAKRCRWVVLLIELDQFIPRQQRRIRWLPQSDTKATTNNVTATIQTLADFILFSACLKAVIDPAHSGFADAG
jgi:hypothetical protein